MDYPVEKAEIAIFLPHYQNSGVILWKMEASFLGGAGLFRTKQTLIITPTFQANAVSYFPLLFPISLCYLPLNLNQLFIVSEVWCFSRPLGRPTFHQGC